MARVAGQAFAAEFAKRAGIYRQRVIKWKQKRGERGISDEKTAGKTAAVLVAALFCAAIAEEAEFSLSPALSKGSVSAISWSYDPAVVSVSPEGLVTAVGVGTTTITARTYNGKKAKCKVAVIAYDVPLSDYRAEHPVRVIAHRGGAGYWSENTLQAFAGAKSKGADAVELDVRTTRDGVQVVHHNVYITYKGRKYAVARFTMDQLRTLVPGICTLDEALEVIADSGLDLWLEMKENANAAACVQAVRRWGLEDRTIYQSFYQDRLAWARRMSA